MTSCMPCKCSWDHLEMNPPFLSVWNAKVKLCETHKFYDGLLYLRMWVHAIKLKEYKRDLLFQALAAITAKLQVALGDSKGPTPIEALSKLPLERLQVVHQRSLQLLKKPWQFKGNVNQIKDATKILGISLKHFSRIQRIQMNPSNSSLTAMRQITYIFVVAPNLGYQLSVVSYQLSTVVDVGLRWDLSDRKFEPFDCCQWSLFNFVTQNTHSNICD